jgi:hypothetical protein
MVNLYTYAPSNEKTGYFLRGHSQSSGYFNLQTIPAANQLFDKLDYEPGRLPHTEGDRIPGELSWRMYQAGLLETENNSSKLDSLSKDQLKDTFNDSGVESTISESDIEVLRSFINSYSGQAEEQVEELLDLLKLNEQALSPSNSNSDVELSEKSVEQLTEWGLTPGDVLNRRTDVVDTPDRYLDETGVCLESLISRAGQCHHSPEDITLTQSGMPIIEYKLELQQSRSIFIDHIWVWAEDYWAQSSGRYNNVDACFECEIALEWQDKREQYYIDAFVTNGSFIQFTPTPSIGDVLGAGANTETISKASLYPRTIRNARNALSELLDIFSVENAQYLFDE